MQGLKPNACADGCESCPVAAAAPKPKGPYAGWRLGLVSLGYFIFPIVSAFIGARLGAPGHDGQALGALVGLAVGMSGAIALAQRAQRRRPSRAEISSRRVG